MKRRTLDVLFSVGGLVLAGLLLALLSLAGLVHAFKTSEDKPAGDKSPGDKTFETPHRARVAAVGPYLAGI